jgi:hypothetical protein
VVKLWRSARSTGLHIADTDKRRVSLALPPAREEGEEPGRQQPGVNFDASTPAIRKPPTP